MKFFNKLVITLFVAALLFPLAENTVQANDSKGTEFWIAFPDNYPRPGVNNQSTYFQQLLITSNYNTSGIVSIPGIGFSTNFSVSANSSVIVQFPLTVDVNASDVITDWGIHVTSLDDITVYGMNKSVQASDGFLALPLDVLGKEYQVLGYRNVGVVNGNQFLLVGTVDGTVVTITPTVTVGTRTAGVPYNITLNQSETYLLRDTNGLPSDLTGTRISSTEPVGLFGGHQSANIPRGFVSDDHLVEMIPPMSTFGRSFITVPLATRLNGDFFRVIASEDSTNVQINGVAQAPLSANQYLEVNLTDAASILSDRPILVAQYSASSTFDGVLGDPFMMLVPPDEQYCSTYVAKTPAAGFSGNYLNIVSPNEAVGSITLNGVPIPALDFIQVAGTDYSYARIPVSPGDYILNSDYRFGCHVYGFNFLEGYGYPAGQSAWRLADVVEIESGPEQSTGTVGSEHCVETRVTDGNGGPLAGIRVDFEQRGSNPGGGFSYTNDSGYATHCYIGYVGGIDTILCRYYEFVDTLFKTWDSPQPVELSSFTSVIQDREVKLYWSTSAEINNSGFDVERSASGSAWSKIGFVTGNGTTTLPKNYEFTDGSLVSGRYSYRLKQIDFNGNYEYFNLSNEIEIGVPEKFDLSQNYPNPFNPSTKINYTLPRDGNIALSVFDNSGRLVSKIAEGFKTAGYYSVDFSAANLSSGIYFYKLEFNSSGQNFAKTMKMTVLK